MGLGLGKLLDYGVYSERLSDSWQENTVYTVCALTK